MVIDTSALLAILLGESEAAFLARAIAADPKRLISAMTALEAAIVIEARKGEPGGLELDLLLHRCGVQVVPMTAEHYELARVAWRTFGKGRHAAALNIGDCFAYALAKASRQPLLFKGQDFARTDVVPVSF